VSLLLLSTLNVHSIHHPLRQLFSICFFCFGLRSAFDHVFTADVGGVESFSMRALVEVAEANEWSGVGAHQPMGGSE